MIIGAQVILRHLKEEDRLVYQNWINDRELVHLNSVYHPISDINHQQWFDTISSQPNLVIFSIVEQETDKLIGSCSLRKVDYLHRNAELQIRIGDIQHQGKGLGTEAVELLLCHAFDDLNLHRVYLQVFVNNTRAIHAYKKAGFVGEGCLRQAVYIQGKYKDVLVMGILRNEFEEQRNPC
jgi:RimJ/RimL family protein N-acetyltransferase